MQVKGALELQRRSDPLLVQLIRQMRIPPIYTYRDQAEAGGLMTYSYDIASVIRTQARQLVEILRAPTPATCHLSGNHDDMDL